MIDQMISDVVTDMVQQSILEQLGPYIFVGAITFVMYLGYQVTNKIEDSASKIRNKRKAIRNG